MHRTGTHILGPLPLNHIGRHWPIMFYQSGTRHPPDSRVSGEFRTSRKLKMDNGKNSRVYRGPEGLDPGLMAYSVSIFFLVPLSHIVRSSPVSRFRICVPRLSHVSDCYFQESWICYCMTPLVGAYYQVLLRKFVINNVVNVTIFSLTTTILYSHYSLFRKGMLLFVALTLYFQEVLSHSS